jgi:CheY-like chemotaxis protein/HPt (histidine-containing phosphotransfer) domain-containing protein
VLVVDDVAMNRDIARSFLEAGGHTVTCVDGGAASVAAVAAAPFDVVLMDVRMPDVDGMEATRQIRRLDGTSGRVPIIGLTAQAFAEQIAECRRSGMDGHLAKPYGPESLLAAVAHVARIGNERGESEGPPGQLPAGPAPAPEVVGAGRPVVDHETAGRLSSLLPRDAIDSYMQSIVERGETLRRLLREPDALASHGQEVVIAAHALAGSAGMLGFDRLATTGLLLEHAMQAGAADAPAIASGLCAAIEATLLHIQIHTSYADVP